MTSESLCEPRVFRHTHVTSCESAEPKRAEERVHIGSWREKSRTSTLEGNYSRFVDFTKPETIRRSTSSRKFQAQTVTRGQIRLKPPPPSLPRPFHEDVRWTRRLTLTYELQSALTEKHGVRGEGENFCFTIWTRLENKTMRSFNTSSERSGKISQTNKQSSTAMCPELKPSIIPSIIYPERSAIVLTCSIIIHTQSTYKIQDSHFTGLYIV